MPKPRLLVHLFYVCLPAMALVSMSCQGGQKGATSPGSGGEGAGPGVSSSGGSNASSGGSGSGGSLGSGGADYVPDGSGGSSCLNTDADPHNCGRCGQTCAAAALVSGQTWPGALAVAEGVLYWAQQTGDITGALLMTAPTSGGPATSLTSASNISALAVDATHVYFGDSMEGSIVKVPRAGGAPITLATKQHSVGGLVLDATNVYWTAPNIICPDNADCIPDGKVVRVPKAGGAAVVLAEGQGSIGGLAVDATSVYWVDRSFNVFTGAIRKAPLAGGATTTLASNLNFLSGPIAVASGQVYFTVIASGNQGSVVAKVATTGGAATAAVAIHANGDDLVIDANHIYWIDADIQGYSVRVASLDDGKATILLRTLHPAARLAVDAANVYWTEQAGASNGSVSALGTNRCQAGVCQCAANQSVCFGACVDVTNDSRNCGTCSNVCGSGQTCQGGSCLAMSAASAGP